MKAYGNNKKKKIHPILEVCVPNMMHLIGALFYRNKTFHFTNAICYEILFVPVKKCSMSCDLAAY